MSSPQWYRDWASDHQAAFLLPDEWLHAAALWWDTFASLGATADELAAATREVQAGDRVRAWGDHLPALKAAVGRGRDRRAAEAKRAEADGRPDRGVCVDCGDTGWATVPHPKFLNEFGEWVPDGHGPGGEPRWVVCGVACGCVKGRKTMADAQAVGKNPLGLERYGRRCPTWRDQMAVQAAARRRREHTERSTVYPAGLVAAVAAGLGLPANSRPAAPPAGWRDQG